MVHGTSSALMSHSPPIPSFSNILFYFHMLLTCMLAACVVSL